MLPQGTGTPLGSLAHVTEDMQKVLGGPGSPTPLGREPVGTHPACALLTHRLPNNLWLSPGSSCGNWGRAAPQNYRETFGGARGGCLTCPQLHPTWSSRHSLGGSWGGWEKGAPPAPSDPLRAQLLWWGQKRAPTSFSSSCGQGKVLRGEPGCLRDTLSTSLSESVVAAW